MTDVPWRYCPRVDMKNHAWTRRSRSLTQTCHERRPGFREQVFDLRPNGAASQQGKLAPETNYMTKFCRQPFLLYRKSLERLKSNLRFHCAQEEKSPRFLILAYCGAERNYKPSKKMILRWLVTKSRHCRSSRGHYCGQRHIIARLYWPATSPAFISLNPTHLRRHRDGPKPPFSIRLVRQWK